MNWTMLVHAGTLGLAVMTLSMWMPGVHSESKLTSFWVATVFSVLNVGAGYLMRRFLPTDTADTLVIVAPLLMNIVVLWVTDIVIPSFEISSKVSLVVAAAIITLVNKGVDVFLAQHGAKVLQSASRAAGIPQ